MNILSNISSNIDTIIIVIFLAINLAVGFYYGRNVKTLRDYALGGRNYSTATLVATIVATWIGGSSFALSLSETYTQGLWYILAGSGYTFNLLVVAYFLNHRVSEFENSLTVAEGLGNLYGRRIRVITAIASIASTIAVLSLQIKVFSTIFSYFFDVSAVYATVLCSFIVITYSAFGGIRAVTFTDIIQFITFGIVIPIFAIFIWKELANVDLFSKAATNDLFDYKQLFKTDAKKIAMYISIFLSGVIPALNPTVFQRILMAKSSTQVRESFFASFIICLLIYLATCFIGFVIYFHNSELVPETLSFYIIDNYSIAGIKSVALISIIAMIMSTADSWINASSVIFSHDLCPSLKLNPKYELTASRIFAVFLGVSVVFLTLTYEHLLDLLFLSENFYIPVVTPILILTILGFRSNKKIVLTGICIGISVTLLWKIFVQSSTNIESVVPGMIANFLTIYIAHKVFSKSGGWVKIENFENPSEKHNKTITNNETLIKKIAKIFSLESYCRFLPKQSIIYNYFAFASFLTIVTTLSIERSIYNEYIYLINFLQAVACAIATFFLCRDLWYQFVDKKYLGLIWFIAVIINLIVISNYLVLLSNFSHVSLVILTIHLTLVPLLIGWRTALVTILTGTWISYFLYQFYTQEASSIYLIDLRLKLIYTLFMIGSFVLTFLKNKQEYLEATEAKADELEGEVGGLKEEVDNLGHVVVDLNDKVCELNEVANFYSVRVEDQAKEIERLGATAQKILNNVNHELRLPVGNVVNFAEMLSEGLEKYSKEHQKMLLDEVLQNSNRLSSMILNMLDLAMLNAKKIELKKQTINLSEMIYDRVKNCAKIYLQGKHIDFEMNIEPEVFVFVDPNYIRQTIDNLIINAITYSEKGTIEVSLSRGLENNIEITIKDQGIGIPKHELYDIFTPFKMGSKTDTPAQGRGVGLALCKAAVEAHGGVITVESNGYGATFRVLLSLFN